MSDENEKPDEDGADTEDRSPQAGERLAEARRERQISVLEIAKELHLDELKVRALEKNEFESLGAPVFAKGHLRKYAHLVGVDEKDVLADYYGLTRSQAIPPVVADRRRPGRELSLGPWIVAIAIIGVVAAAYWLMTRQPPPAPVQSSSPPVGEEAATAKVAQGSVEAAAAEPDASADVTESIPVGADESEPEPAATSGPERPAAREQVPVAGAAGEPLVEGGVRLTIVFSGDCWTEVFDATGRRLFYSMGRDGQSVDVAGPGPLSVLFGDADNVSLTVNGEAFTIADADRSGRTARFALDGP